MRELDNRQSSSQIPQHPSPLLLKCTDVRSCVFFLHLDIPTLVIQHFVCRLMVCHQKKHKAHYVS